MPALARGDEGRLLQRVHGSLFAIVGPAARWSPFVIRRIFCCVAALARGDAERLLRLVAEAEGFGGDHPFTGGFLAQLGRLVPADWVGYSEYDDREQLCFNLERPGDEGRYSDFDWEAVRPFWKDENPVFLCFRQGNLGALKLSDFLGRRDLHGTRMYRLVLQPCGVEDMLCVRIRIPPPWYSKLFILDRTGRDFSERDRLVLDLLQPHLGRLWQAATTRRRLAAALAGLEQAAESDRRGVILLDSVGKPEFASPPARRLLGDFFPDAARGRLPGALVKWLQSGSQRPLTRTRGDRRLTVERGGDALLLGERQDTVSLTAREREVLSWVARGKTNPEIAQILWVAPSTVRKHLENVYAKLGVGTRTEAATRFLGLIER